MKIEKINERQIRCTLTREDLASRHIRLSELAYGSEKAKELFQDMMQLAAESCGFEVDNDPLMIEAVPISHESILLIVTKVEDPEELDTRFSRFSPDTSPESESFDPSGILEHIAGADDLIGLLSRLSEARQNAAHSREKDAKPALPEPAGQTAAGKSAETAAAKGDPNDPQLRRFTQMFLFDTLDDVIQASAALPTGFRGSCHLYKDPEDGSFYLLLRKGETSPQEFNAFCNAVSEFSAPGKYTEGMDSYFREHFESILQGPDVLDQLRALS